MVCGMSLPVLIACLLLEFIKGATRSCMRGREPRECLPTANDDVDIGGVEFNAIADPAGALGRDHSRATAQKRIKHNVSPSRAVHDRVCDESDRFDRGMQLE